MYRYDGEYDAVKDNGARRLLIAIADIFQNDYLTADVFAQHNGITCEQARVLIALAQEVRASKHPEA